MSLDPFFSVSARNPWFYSYDPAYPGAAYADARLYSYGGHTSLYGGRNLEDQHANDRLLIAYDSVADTDQTVTDYNDGFYNRSVVQTSFKGVNVGTNNQYLLIFRLAKAFGSPISQFFIGTDFVRAEALTSSPPHDIAILLDVPGDNIYVYVYVRLASVGGTAGHGIYFHGVDGYLL